MKLYDVVFTNDRIKSEDTQNSKFGDLKFVEATNDKNPKYRSIYIENTITQQRYFLNKHTVGEIIKSRKDKSAETYPDFIIPKVTDMSYEIDDSNSINYICTEYDFGENESLVDKRNYNIVIGDPSGDDCNIISVSIDNSAYQLIDYYGGHIVQTGKKNDFRSCILYSANIEYNPNETEMLYVMGLILRPINDCNSLIRFNIMMSYEGLSIHKYELMYSDPDSYINYLNTLSTNEKYYKEFKVCNFEGICTEAVLVNEKYKKVVDGEVTFPVIANNNIPGKENIQSIITCTEETINSDKIDDTLLELITKKSVRAVTAIGLKFNKDFYKKYKILYMFSYNPKTKISTCIKSN